MSRRQYSPPQGMIYQKDGTFEITGCSGFLIENLGGTPITCGPKGGEVIPINPGESREFEAPEGGVYKGNYSILFASGTGQALIIRNIGKDVSDIDREASTRLKKSHVETI